MCFAGDLHQRPHLDAGLLHRQDEQTQALVLGHIPVGAGQQQRVVGGLRARCPHLLTVDDPAVCVPHRGRSHGGEVRTRTGLGVEQAGARPFDEEVAQQVVLERGGAERERRVGGDVVLVLTRARRLGRGELLRDDVGQVGGVSAAEPVGWVGRYGESGVEHLLQPGDPFGGGRPRIDVAGQRRPVVAQPVPDFRAQLVGGGQRGQRAVGHVRHLSR